jgi:hypothetical protein
VGLRFNHITPGPGESSRLSEAFLQLLFLTSEGSWVFVQFVLCLSVMKNKDYQIGEDYKGQ